MFKKQVLNFSDKKGFQAKRVCKIGRTKYTSAKVRPKYTCWEMENPMMMSPSGTSQDTVAESALRCMTETLTGAGGRSGNTKLILLTLNL